MSGNGASRTALVLGAGFAGFGAAVELASRGWRVTVLEKAPRLGGRTSSFTDRVTGERCDNGQHVMLSGYRNTRALFARVGAAGHVHFQDALSVVYALEGGRSFSFRGSTRLPAPFHLASGFFGNPLLGVRDRIALGRAAGAIIRMSDAEVLGLEGTLFLDWLREHGQPRSCIDAFWEPITLGTINVGCAQVSCLPILRVLRLGFLGAAGAARLGYPVVPLGELFEAMAAFVRARGGEVRERARVVGIEGGEVTLAGGERLQGDVAISALPFQSLRAIREDLVPEKLGPAPIADVHVWLDRPIFDGVFVAVLGGRMAQWVWNRARMLRSPPASDAILHSVTISGADEALALPTRELERLVLEDLRRFFPAMAGAAVKKVHTIKEPFATLRLLPGAERLRPGARTADPRLFLAGDWTATGFPSTIEGAVISGLRAVEAVTGDSIALPLEGQEDLPVRIMRRLHAGARG